MFKKILVPLDGSLLADKALPYAEALAKAGSHELMLVRALQFHAATPHDVLEKEIEAKPEAEADLDAIAKHLAGDGITARGHVVVGEPAAVINQEAEDTDADLIVMATHGRGGLGRWAFGSVAERVLRLTRAPVFMVPAHSDRRWTLAGPRAIVLPLDGSELAEEALRPARTLAKALGARLSLVQVVEPPPIVAYDSAAVYSPLDLGEWVEQARPYLDGQLARLHADGFEATGQTLLGYVASTIQSVVEAENAAAIVMATHGRTGLARVVLGSVAMGVLQRAAAPVLLLRPSALAPLESPARAGAVPV